MKQSWRQVLQKSLCKYAQHIKRDIIVSVNEIDKNTEWKGMKKSIWDMRVEIVSIKRTQTE